MVYDSDEGLFHLTCDGWVRADEKPYPGERIETWSYTMHQSSGWSAEERRLKCVWADTNIDREKRDGFRKKYGWPYGMKPGRRVRISEPL